MDHIYIEPNKNDDYKGRVVNSDDKEKCRTYFNNQSTSRSKEDVEIFLSYFLNYS
jgi:hypothetical protein